MSLDLHLVRALLTLGATVACGGGETPADEPEEVADQTPGILRTDDDVIFTDDDVIFRTKPFTLEPGQERFVCYTQPLREDLVIDGYTTPAKPFVHHIVFAETTGTESEGASDGDVLFRFVWEPPSTFEAAAHSLQQLDQRDMADPSDPQTMEALEPINAPLDKLNHVVARVEPLPGYEISFYEPQPGTITVSEIKPMDAAQVSGALSWQPTRQLARRPADSTDNSRTGAMKRYPRERVVLTNTCRRPSSRKMRRTRLITLFNDASVTRALGQSSSNSSVFNATRFRFRTR